MVIYLLLAVCDYESRDFVIAFSDKDFAEKECDRANAYQDTKPNYAEEKTFEEWQSSHPYPDCCFCDSFDIVEVELIQ